MTNNPRQLKTFNANDNLYDAMGDRREVIQEHVEEACEELLDALVIDVENDPNAKDTAKRMAKMYVNEVFAGRYKPRPDITTFPNTKQLDEIYTVGPINVRSACSHHMVPIIGRVWVGVLPGNTLIGLSKFARLAEWVMARPHIQEDATVMLADEIERACSPLGLGIVYEAQHFCMVWRGVKEPDAVMTSSVMRGTFREDPAARAELMALIKRD